MVASQQKLMLLLAILTPPLLTGCSGCTCSQSLVRSKPLLPKISVKNILLEEIAPSCSTCGVGQRPCACGCQNTRSYPLATCQQMTTSTSQNALPTPGYSAINTIPAITAPGQCCYSNTHLYAAVPGFTCPATPSNHYGNQPLCQCAPCQPSSTPCAQSYYANRPYSMEQTPVTCQCANVQECNCEGTCDQRRSRGKNKRRRSGKKRCRSESSESESDEESEECSGKSVLKGCIKLPFFAGTLKIG